MRGAIRGHQRGHQRHLELHLMRGAIIGHREVIRGTSSFTCVRAQGHRSQSACIVSSNSTCQCARNCAPRNCAQSVAVSRSQSQSVAISVPMIELNRNQCASPTHKQGATKQSVATTHEPAALPEPLSSRENPHHPNCIPPCVTLCACSSPCVHAAARAHPAAASAARDSHRAHATPSRTPAAAPPPPLHAHAQSSRAQSPPARSYLPPRRARAVSLGNCR